MPLIIGQTLGSIPTRNDTETEKRREGETSQSAAPVSVLTRSTFTPSSFSIDIPSSLPFLRLSPLLPLLLLLPTQHLNRVKPRCFLF